ncbi:hypothetical protein AZ22_2894, partial [Bordetella bronchiseptica 980-2]
MPDHQCLSAPQGQDLQMPASGYGIVDDVGFVD